MPFKYNPNRNTLDTTEVKAPVSCNGHTSSSAKTAVEAAREEAKVCHKVQQINEKPQTSGFRLAEVGSSIGEPSQKLFHAHDLQKCKMQAWGDHAFGTCIFHVHEKNQS